MELAKYPEVLITDGKHGTNRARMVVQFVMGVNARLRPTPLCTAFVPGESKASHVQVYRCMYYIMKRLGWSLAFRWTRLFVSDSALGPVRAHRALSQECAFGGEAAVLVVRLPLAWWETWPEAL
jgi:hypothetical protein